MKTSFRHSLAIGLLAIALAGCKTQPTSDTHSSSPAQTVSGTPTPSPVDKPSLSSEVTNVSLYPVPNKREHLAVSMLVAVRNDGATANAQDWTLAVEAPGRFDLRGIQPVHVNGIVDLPGTTGKRVDLDKEDLVIRSKDTPIAKGGSLTGILTFVLARTSTADLSNNKAMLVLHFKDNQGNSYQTGGIAVGSRRQ